MQNICLLLFILSTDETENEGGSKDLEGQGGEERASSEKDERHNGENEMTPAKWARCHKHTRSPS